MTTNTINRVLDYLSLAPFLQCALISFLPGRAQGMTAALMDLIDGALLRVSEALEAHFLLFTPKRLAQAT